MRYLCVSLGISLKTQLRSVRFWTALGLAVAAGLLVRSGAQPDAEGAAVEVGVVVSQGSENLWEALDRRSSSLIRFVPASEPTARAKVAASQWDCALLLPESLFDPITLLTGPGSAVYLLVRETAAAALLEQTSQRIAEEYLLDSGIAGENMLPDLRPRLAEAIPEDQRVRLELVTLTGEPLREPELAARSFSQIFRGTLAAALLVWTLFATVDLGRWSRSGEAKRLRPCVGILLPVPRLLGAVIPAFLFGASGLLAAGESAACIAALVPYLLALGALALLLPEVRPLWKALPALVPFAAAGTFVLSQVFVDTAALFPQLGPVCSWLPVTLFLQGCNGSTAAFWKLLLLAGVFAGTAAALSHRRNRA